MDGKHTIFGKLVGGLDTLSEMEKIEVDNKDRPIEDIIIEKTQVFVDPYQEADEQLAEERAEEAAKLQKAIQDEQKRKQRNQPLKVFRQGVGKYLNTANEVANPLENESVIKRKKDKPKSGFGNFSSW